MCWIYAAVTCKVAQFWLQRLPPSTAPQEEGGGKPGGDAFQGMMQLWFVSLAICPVSCRHVLPWQTPLLCRWMLQPCRAHGLWSRTSRPSLPRWHKRLGDCLTEFEP